MRLIGGVQGRRFMRRLLFQVLCEALRRTPLGHRSLQAVLGINPQMQHQRPERSRDTLKLARERQQRSFIPTRPREHPCQIDPRPILNPHGGS